MVQALVFVLSSLLLTAKGLTVSTADPVHVPLARRSARHLGFNEEATRLRVKYGLLSKNSTSFQRASRRASSSSMSIGNQVRPLVQFFLFNSSRLPQDQDTSYIGTLTIGTP